MAFHLEETNDARIAVRLTENEWETALRFLMIGGSAAWRSADRGDVMDRISRIYRDISRQVDSGVRSAGS